MTILLISIVWFVALAALVFLLARRPMGAQASWERSPRLLQAARVSFEQAMQAMLASDPAAAKDVRDRAQEDLYVRP
jgi:ABC-type sulfate transport system permease component